MTIEEINHTIKKIKKKWDQDKEGWSVISGFDKDGNKEMLINQNPNTYWLKMRPLSPNNFMGYGQEIRNLDDDINSQLDPLFSEKKQLNEIVSAKKKEFLEKLGYFSMGVPDVKNKEILFTSGLEFNDEKLTSEQKNKIEEKQANSDLYYRKYMDEKWKRIHQLRDNMYS